MYCSNCGNKISNKNNKFCTNCGIKLAVDNSMGNKNLSKNNWMKISSIILGSLSIVGSLLIIFAPLSFILSIIGLIITFISLKKEKNTIGIITNLIGLILSIIVNILLLFIIINIFGTVSDKGIDWVTDLYNNHFGELNKEHYGNESSDIISRY